MENLEKRVDALMRLCMADRESDRERVKEEIKRLLELKKFGGIDPEQEVREILEIVHAVRLEESVLFDGRHVL